MKKIVLFVLSVVMYTGIASAQPFNGLSLDGVNDRVAINSSPSLNISSAITIESWIYYTRNSGVQNVVSKSSNVVNNSYIFPRTADGWRTVEFRIFLNVLGWQTLTVPFSGIAHTFRNEWHHLAATYDGFTMSIYVDGVLAGSREVIGTITTNNNQLFIGGHNGFAEWFQGKVDDVRIWNRSLTQCEIANNMNCELTGSETGLAAYYKFNQGLADAINDPLSLLITTAYDATANANHGILTNFLLSGISSNWTTGIVSGNCTPYAPVEAVAGSVEPQIVVGSDIQLTASGGDTYAWTGPNGFTSTEQNPVITNATQQASGTYTVVVTRNGCSASASTSILVTHRAKALFFDGQDNIIRIPNSPSLNFSNALTIESWIYPVSSSPLVQNVICKSTQTNNGGYIFPRTDDGWQSFSFWLQVNGQWRVIAAPLTGLNRWTHVTATYDGLFMKIYMDGVEVGSLSAPGTITQNTNDVTIGQQASQLLNEYYFGGLDEVRIWNRALTQCEIQNNMSCELNGANNGLAAQSGLSAYYRFNQGLVGGNNASVATLVDSSGNNNNGQLLNFDLTGTVSNWGVGGSVNNSTCTPYTATLASITSNGPVVEVGHAIELTASEGTAWSWTGPAGFTSNQQHVVINNSTTDRSGVYTVSITGNGCTSTISTRIKVAYRAGTLHFDGVNDQVVVPNSPSLNINKTITLESWIRPTNGSRMVQSVLSKSTRDVNNGYIFPRTDDGWQNIVFYLHVNGVWEKVMAPYPGLNEWHHVSATYDGYYMRIYIDGLLKATHLIANGGNITVNSNNLMIGQQGGYTLPGIEEYYQGDLEELRIWSRSLSQCEIINNMNCEVGQLQNNGLAAYYKFNQGFVDADNTAITTLTDATDNGNNGTLQQFALDGLTSNWSTLKVSGTCVTYAAPPVAASANGTVFAPGSIIRLYGTGGITYSWEGPAGFVSPEPSPVITNVQLSNTGVYTVTAPFINCVITASVRLVVSNLAPLSASGPTTFCPSGSVTLSTNNAGTAYQWFRDGVEINGATEASYVATLSGNYTVSVTTPTEVLVSEPVLVTVTDNMAPQPVVASLPVLNLVTPAVVTVIPTAIDNCAGTITATTEDVLTFNEPGEYTITWTYDDGNGNISTQTQEVIVVWGADLVPPVLTVPANITRVNDNGICGAVVNFAATATDNRPDPVTITYSQDPGTVFPVGTTTVVVTATDGAGNTATGSFTITITDATAPVLTLPANVSATSSTGITVGTATATDNCGTAVVTHSTIPVTFPLGVTNITWTATDAAGNTATGIQTVTVTDATAPVLSGVPANTTALCGILPAVAVVTATDDFDANPSVTLVQTQNGNTVTRTWTATDASGNSSSASQIITLIPDTEAPVLTLPANIESSSATGINIGTATATDNCSTPTVTHSAIPSVFPLGVTNITWTATDAAGNVTTGIQTVTVTASDVTPPVLVGVPANTTAACGVIPAVPVVTATDDFDPNPVVTMTETVNGNIITRTWTATDASGNSSSASQTITVLSTAAPVITGPTSGTVVTQNPVAAALNFNVFAQNGVTFGNGQSHGPVALGGNLTLSGGYSVSNNSAGTFKVSNVPVTLLMGGKVIYQGGNGINVNQNGYVKIGDNTGSYVWYKDQNNAFSPIRITPGSNYNGSPRINLQANSQNLGVSATNNPVFEGGLIDFAAAFNQLKANATSLSALTANAGLTNPNGGSIPHTNLPSQVKINLAAGVNVLNINASDLNNVQNFTYNNQPDASRILIINVNAPGSFNWNVWNSGGIGDQNTRYILYNFYNTTALTVQGNGSVMGTLFAPYATINKSSSQNITGQIIGQSFAHTSGTNTYNRFEGTVTSGSTTVIAQNSDNTRNTNNASCTYTVAGSEFNITAVPGDDCGSGVVTLSYTLSGATTGAGSNLAGVTLNAGTTTVTWTATSGSAVSTYVFNVTVQAPTVAAITGNTTVTAGSTTQLSNSTTGGTWSSSNTNVATVNANGLVSGVSAGSAVISYTIATEGGCTKVATANVTVNPNCAVPVVTAANVTASTTSASANCTSPVTYTVNITGTPAPTVTYTLSGATTGSGNGTGSGVVFNTGVTTVVVKAVNSCGTHSATFTVTLKDGTAPVPNVSVLPTITGQCSVNLATTSNTGSNYGACEDDCRCCRVVCHCRTRVCKCRDWEYKIRSIVSLILYYLGGGNNWDDDDHGCGDDDNSSSNSNAQASNAPKATDNCKGTITGTTTDPLTYTTQGTYTINWKFDDGNGNVTFQQQTVIVKDDVKPVLNSPNNITVSCNSNTTPSGCNSVATATDNCGTPVVTYSDVTNGNVITRTWKATDAAGNFSTATQTITIVDNTKPTISGISDKTVSCNGSTEPSATGTPNVSDNCSAVTLTYSDATSGNVITRTWRATDASGNVSTATQKITKTADNTKPTISGISDKTVSCTGSTEPSATGTPNVSDNCSAVTLTYSDAVKNNVITRTWKATDASGNSSTATQKITVTVDNTKPTISGISDVNVSCSGSTDPQATGRPTASDNCSAVTLTYTDAVKNNVITRTWKATDESGNSNTVTQKITVAVDNTKPTISVVPDRTISCSGSTAPSATGTPTASDNCSTPVITYSDATNGNVITRTWRATDAAGNFSTSTQKITLSSAFNASVSSKPTSNTYTGGISTNLYLGYGAQSTKLEVCDLPSSGAPYTYSWSGSATNRLNSTSSSAPTFTPTAAGTYTYYVTVTNKFGCTSSDYITICVTDIRVPGTNGSKVYVCHKTGNKKSPYQTLQVSVNAVASHLNHGGCGNDDDDDRLGSCDQTPCNTAVSNSVATTNTQTVTAEGGVTATTNAASSKPATTVTEEELKVTVMPNPSTTYFTLKFESRNQMPLNLRVMDGNGRVVDARSQIGANSTLQIGHNYSSGTYYAEISQNGKRKVIQLIKARG